MRNRRNGDSITLNNYCHWGKHVQKSKLAAMLFLTFSAWPRECTAYRQILSLSLTNSPPDYSASSSKVYISVPSIVVLAPPSSPQRWGIPRNVSWSTDSPSLEQSLLYLMNLASFGFVLRCSSCEFITLVYTKTVDSVFRALRLASQSVNILHLVKSTWWSIINAAF